MIFPGEGLPALLGMALSALSTWKPRPDLYLTENSDPYSLYTLEVCRTETLYVKLRYLALFLNSPSIRSLQLKKKKILPLKPPIVYDIFIKPISLLASIPSGILNENLCTALMFDNTLFPSLYLDPTGA